MTNSTQNQSNSLPLKDGFATFFEEPSRETLRNLLQNQRGEFPHLEFKREWPTSPSIARHILGIANSGGGCIVVGVAELKNNTLESTGLNELVDKAKVTNGLDKYLPHPLKNKISIYDFSYTSSEYPKLEGKLFQVAFIEPDASHLPFVSMAESDNEIKKDKIYVRRGTSTVEANYYELQDIINRRIETAYSSSNEIDLRSHLEELKLLYDQISPVKYFLINSLPLILTEPPIDNKAKHYKRAKNEHYPKEDYDAFIARMIEKKKKRIEIALNVADL